MSSTGPAIPGSNAVADATWTGRQTTALVVGASALSAAVVQLIGAGRPKTTSWHFFNDAARLLFAHGHMESAGSGLDVYAAHPKFQFGPFTIIVAQVIRLVSFGHGTIGASLVIGALVPLMLWLILDAARLADPFGGALPVRAALIGGIPVAVPWAYLSVYSLHLDDALAVVFTVLALWGVAKRSDLAVGLGLGLAIASKPWAAAFLPVALALPKGNRLRGATIAIVSGIALWLPFVIDAHSTIAALGHFTIRNVPDSALRALGVHTTKTPSWDRVAQISVGATAGVWCVRTGRWPAAVMMAAAVRIALDPGAHLYYTSSLVAFVLAWELISRRSSIPLLSIVTGFALIEPRYLGVASSIAGDIRLGACVAILVMGLLVKGPGTTGSALAVAESSSREHAQPC